MLVTVNGETRELSESLRLDQLVEELGLGGKRLAIERNREIVRSHQWAEVTLSEGDTIEIVHFVGGG